MRVFAHRASLTMKKAIIMHNNASRFRFSRTALTAVSLTLFASLGLAGCGASTQAESPTQEASETSNETAPTLVNGWAKATEGMSGVFGELTNPGSEDVSITSASSTAAQIVELHETVMVDGQMKMQEVEGGFMIPAGGTYTLEPGGDHIMLMEMPDPLLPGEQISVTLNFSDGTVQELLIDVRDFAGANEEYSDLESHDDQ